MISEAKRRRWNKRSQTRELAVQKVRSGASEFDVYGPDLRLNLWLAYADTDGETSDDVTA